MKATDLKSNKPNELEKAQRIRLHNSLKEWLSELMFWKEEINFQKKLILNYAFHLEEESDIAKLKFEVNKLGGDLEEELDTLLKRVELLDSCVLQESEYVDIKDVVTEHEVLRLRIEYFREEYKDTKDNIMLLLKAAFKNGDREVIDKLR